MQTHLYLIDYFNPLFCNGLNSYITQLTRKLVLQKDIQLHIIWANTLFSSEIKTKIIESVEHIHFPFDIALQIKPINYIKKINIWLLSIIKAKSSFLHLKR